MSIVENLYQPMSYLQGFGSPTASLHFLLSLFLGVQVANSFPGITFSVTLSTFCAVVGFQFSDKSIFYWSILNNPISILVSAGMASWIHELGPTSLVKDCPATPLAPFFRAHFPTVNFLIFESFVIWITWEPPQSSRAGSFCLIALFLIYFFLLLFTVSIKDNQCLQHFT